eukprot:gene6930-7148_t
MHNGEVLALAASGNLLISGGADFQIKSWTAQGELLSASAHHHAPVQCLTAVPLLPGNNTPGPTPAGIDRSSSRRHHSGAVLQHNTTPNRRTRSSNGAKAGAAAAGTSGASGSVNGVAAAACCNGFKLWAGAADGSLSVCVDSSGSGQLDPAGWKVLRLEGMQDNRLWVGCEDGRVFVFDTMTEALLTSFKAQASAVKSLALLGGSDVWSAAERSLAVHDAESGTIKHLVPLDDSGFVKQLLPWRWGLWVLSFNGLKLLAARSCWEAAQQQATSLSQQLSSAHQQLQASRLLSDQQALQISQQQQQLEDLGLHLSAAQTQLESSGQQVSADAGQAHEQLLAAQEHLLQQQKQVEQLQATVTTYESQVLDLQQQVVAAAQGTANAELSLSSAKAAAQEAERRMAAYLQQVVQDLTTQLGAATNEKAASQQQLQSLQEQHAQALVLQKETTRQARAEYAAAAADLVTAQSELSEVKAKLVDRDQQLATAQQSKAKTEQQSQEEIARLRQAHTEQLRQAEDEAQLEHERQLLAEQNASSALIEHLQQTSSKVSEGEEARSAECGTSLQAAGAAENQTDQRQENIVDVDRMPATAAEAAAELRPQDAKESSTAAEHLLQQLTAERDELQIQLAESLKAAAGHLSAASPAGGPSPTAGMALPPTGASALALPDPAPASTAADSGSLLGPMALPGPAAAGDGDYNGGWESSPAAAVGDDDDDDDQLAMSEGLDTMVTATAHRQQLEDVQAELAAVQEDKYQLQASADYMLILSELSKMRSEGLSQQQQLQEALAARGVALAEVAR